MSAERGVAVYLDEDDVVMLQHPDPNGNPYVAFPEAYAAALVDVAEAARGESVGALIAALDRLAAAKAKP